MLFVLLAPKLLPHKYVGPIYNIRHLRADPLFKVPLIAFL